MGDRRHAWETVEDVLLTFQQASTYKGTKKFEIPKQKVVKHISQTTKKNVPDVDVDPTREDMLKQQLIRKACGSGYSNELIEYHWGSRDISNQAAQMLGLPLKHPISEKTYKTEASCRAASSKVKKAPPEVSSPLDKMEVLGSASSMDKIAAQRATASSVDSISAPRLAFSSINNIEALSETSSSVSTPLNVSPARGFGTQMEITYRAASPPSRVSSAASLEMNTSSRSSSCESPPPCPPPPEEFFSAPRRCRNALISSLLKKGLIEPDYDQGVRSFKPVENLRNERPLRNGWGFGPKEEPFTLKKEDFPTL